MSYANSTTGLFPVPYWARGERSSGDSNLRQAQILTNQLEAAVKFFGIAGVIQEGTYTGAFSSGASIVTLAPNGAIPTLEAVINYRYVYQTSNLIWQGLPNSSTVYLYAQAVEQNIYTANQVSTLQDRVCQAVWNTTGLTPNQSILLAKVVTTAPSHSL